MKLRNRLIKPEAAAGVPREIRAFYAGLWALADDRGCLPDSPAELKEALYPGDAEIGPESVAGMIDWLVRLGKVVRYRVGSRGYLLLLEYLQYEEITRPAVASCMPLAKDLEFDEKTWRWHRIPEHYLAQAKTWYADQAPVGVQTELPLETEKKPEKPKKKAKGPVYTEEEKLLVRHFKERLQEAGADHFPPDWHLRQLPAARRLLEGGRTVEQVMACIDWAFTEKKAGRLRMNLDHLLAIERVWPRFRIRAGGADGGVFGKGAASNFGAGWSAPVAGDAARGATPSEAAAQRDYVSGQYSGFFGRQVAPRGGGAN